MRKFGHWAVFKELAWAPCSYLKIVTPQMSADDSCRTPTIDRFWGYIRRIAGATSVKELEDLREEIRCSGIAISEWDCLKQKVDSFKHNLQVYISHQIKMLAMHKNQWYRVRKVQLQLRQITKDLQQATEELNSIVEQPKRAQEEAMRIALAEIRARKRAKTAAMYDEMYTALDQIRARKGAPWERMCTALAEMRARNEQARAEQATELARRRKLVGLLVGVALALCALWA